MAKTELPTGYDDDAGFLAEMRERWTEATTYDKHNVDAARDDLRFTVGEQWEPNVRAAREAQGLPCLTVNRLPQFIAQVTGDIRINKPAIKVRPDTDGDEKIADIRQGLIRAIEQRCKASAVYSSTAFTQVACGIGWFRLRLEYATDEGFDRDLAIRPIADPFSVVVDPLAIENTCRDADWLFVSDDMPRKRFETVYPGKLPSTLDTQVIRDAWVTKDIVRLSEYWVMVDTNRDVAQMDDGSVMDLADVPEGRKPKATRKASKREAWLYMTNGVELLSGPHKMPIDRIPVFRAVGWEVPIDGKRQRFGLVRFAKDPARLMNYWRSASAQLIGQAPRTQWIAAQRSIDGREEEFRAAHKSGDPLLIYNDAGPQPERVNPAAVPSAMLQEAQLASQDMKDVTGLHDASLGAQGNETSGKAIMARDRQGDVATFIYPDNLKDAIAECGRVINALIPLIYDTARTIAIIGQDDSSSAVRINDPAHPENVDIAHGKYAVTIETGPSYSTRRVEAAEAMLQFVQAVPGSAQFIGDLIAKSQDWPLADEIAERLKRAMPPQITADKDAKPEPPTPEQQQAMQQQQQAAALQQHMAMLEMGIKEAVQRKASAEADKTEAEAALLQFELGQQDGRFRALVDQTISQELFNAGHGHGVAAEGGDPSQMPPPMAQDGPTASADNNGASPPQSMTDAPSAPASAPDGIPGSSAAPPAP